ncbi:uncharacterized protein LOC133180422 [Saccostrea echinata]|uniref:uncharacterized protein LOC133180422 n=1 Tax=Saccostrea echinata TaxID=191078 RepID=UPI002A83CEDA|nr:uncharacterized protein LOC133180422 [Saccostrea echinata]
MVAHSEDFDVLVNSTSPELELKAGFVSRKILETAGPEIQNECKKNYKGGIKVGKVAVTKGYNLKCKFVFHGCMYKYDPDFPAEPLKSVRIFVRNCLETSDKLKMESIAFPALGTGQLGYNRRDIANIIFKEVEKYEKEVKIGSLNRVCCVIYQGDIDSITEFQKRHSVWIKDHKKEMYQELVVTTDRPEILEEIRQEVLNMKSTKLTEPPRSEISETERLGETTTLKGAEKNVSRNQFQESGPNLCREKPELDNMELKESTFHKRTDPMSKERQCVLLKFREPNKHRLQETEVRKDFRDLAENIVCPFQSDNQALLQFSSEDGIERVYQMESLKWKYDLQRFPQQAVIDLRAVVSQKMVKLLKQRGITEDLIRQKSGVTIDQKEPSSMVLCGNVLEVKAAFDFLSSLLKKPLDNLGEQASTEDNQHKTDVETSITNTDHLKQMSDSEKITEEAKTAPEQLQQFEKSSLKLSQVSFTSSMAPSTHSVNTKDDQKKELGTVDSEIYQPSYAERNLKGPEMQCTYEDYIKLRHFYKYILDNIKEKWSPKKTTVTMRFANEDHKAKLESMLQRISRMSRKTIAVQSKLDFLDELLQQKCSNDLFCYLTKDNDKIEIIGNKKKIVEKAEKELEELLAPKTGIEEEVENSIPLPVFITNEGISVFVYHGSLFTAKVDAIVCPISNRFDLHGLPKVIAEKAGPEFKKKVDEILQRHNGKLPKDFVCVIPGGEIPSCKYVVNIVTDRTKSMEDKECKQSLQFKMLQICQEAKKKELQSIALPAICSGKTGYPKEICVNCYASSIVKYSSSVDDMKGLREIHFVDQSEEMIIYIESVFSNPDMIEEFKVEEHPDTQSDNKNQPSLYPYMDEDNTCYLNECLKISVIKKDISKVGSDKGTLVYNENLEEASPLEKFFKLQIGNFIGKNKQQSDPGNIGDVELVNDTSRRFEFILKVYLPVWDKNMKSQKPEKERETFLKSLSLGYAKIFEEAIKLNLFHLILPLYGAVEGNNATTKDSASCFIQELTIFAKRCKSFQKEPFSIVMANKDQLTHDIILKELKDFVESEQAGFHNQQARFQLPRSCRRKNQRRAERWKSGDQPKGIMCKKLHDHFPGAFDNCKTIELKVRIPNGTQESFHPNPGKHFIGRKESIFLPDNTMGRKIAGLYMKAFQQGILYTLSTSRTSGVEMVMPTDIPIDSKRFELCVRKNIKMASNSGGKIPLTADPGGSSTENGGVAVGNVDNACNTGTFELSDKHSECGHTVEGMVPPTGHAQREGEINQASASYHAEEDIKMGKNFPEANNQVPVKDKKVLAANNDYTTSLDKDNSFKDSNKVEFQIPACKASDNVKEMADERQGNENRQLNKTEDDDTRPCYEDIIGQDLLEFTQESVKLTENLSDFNEMDKTVSHSKESNNEVKTDEQTKTGQSKTIIFEGDEENRGSKPFDSEKNVEESASFVKETSISSDKISAKVEKKLSESRLEENKTKYGKKVDDQGSRDTIANTEGDEMGSRDTKANTEGDEMGSRNTKTNTGVDEMGSRNTKSYTEGDEMGSGNTEANTEGDEMGSRNNKANTGVDEMGSRNTEANTEGDEMGSRDTVANTEGDEMGSRDTKANSEGDEMGSRNTKANNGVDEMGSRNTKEITEVDEMGSGNTKANTEGDEMGSGNTEANTEGDEMGSRDTEANTEGDEMGSTNTKASTEGDEIGRPDTIMDANEVSTTESGTTEKNPSTICKMGEKETLNPREHDNVDAVMREKQDKESEQFKHMDVEQDDFKEKDNTDQHPSKSSQEMDDNAKKSTHIKGKSENNPSDENKPRETEQELKEGNGESCDAVVEKVSINFKHGDSLDRDMVNTHEFSKNVIALTGSSGASEKRNELNGSSFQEGDGSTEDDIGAAKKLQFNFVAKEYVDVGEHVQENSPVVKQPSGVSGQNHSDENIKVSSIVPTMKIHSLETPLKDLQDNGVFYLSIQDTKNPSIRGDSILQNIHSIDQKSRVYNTSDSQSQNSGGAKGRNVQLKRINPEEKVLDKDNVTHQARSFGISSCEMKSDERKISFDTPTKQMEFTEGTRGRYLEYEMSKGEILAVDATQKEDTSPMKDESMHTGTIPNHNHEFIKEFENKKKDSEKKLFHQEATYLKIESTLSGLNEDSESSDVEGDSQSVKCGNGEELPEMNRNLSHPDTTSVQVQRSLKITNFENQLDLLFDDILSDDTTLKENTEEWRKNTKKKLYSLMINNLHVLSQELTSFVGGVSNDEIALENQNEEHQGAKTSKAALGHTSIPYADEENEVAKYEENPLPNLTTSHAKPSSEDPGHTETDLEYNNDLQKGRTTSGSAIEKGAKSKYGLDYAVKIKFVPSLKENPGLPVSSSECAKYKDVCTRSQQFLMLMENLHTKVETEYDERDGTLKIQFTYPFETVDKMLFQKWEKNCNDILNECVENTVYVTVEVQERKLKQVEEFFRSDDAVKRKEIQVTKAQCASGCCLLGYGESVYDLIERLFKKFRNLKLIDPEANQQLGISCVPLAKRFLCIAKAFQAIKFELPIHKVPNVKAYYSEEEVKLLGNVIDMEAAIEAAKNMQWLEALFKKDVQFKEEVMSFLQRPGVEAYIDEVIAKGGLGSWRLIPDQQGKKIVRLYSPSEESLAQLKDCFKSSFDKRKILILKPDKFAASLSSWRSTAKQLEKDTETKFFMSEQQKTDNTLELSLRFTADLSSNKSVQDFIEEIRAEVLKEAEEESIEESETDKIDLSPMLYRYICKYKSNQVQEVANNEKLDLHFQDAGYKIVVEGSNCAIEFFKQYFANFPWSKKCIFLPESIVKLATESFCRRYECLAEIDSFQKSSQIQYLGELGFVIMVCCFETIDDLHIDITLNVSTVSQGWDFQGFNHAQFEGSHIRVDVQIPEHCDEGKEQHKAHEIFQAIFTKMMQTKKRSLHIPMKNIGNWPVRKFVKCVLFSLGRLSQENTFQVIFSDKDPRRCNKMIFALNESVNRTTQGNKLVELNVVKGEIAKADADVIVNTTSKDFNLSLGAVSSSIMKEARGNIQLNLKGKTANYGEILVTDSYHLKCKKVFHGALKSWTTDPKEEKECLKVLRQFVTNCLGKASELGYSSIAFPAIGTGRIGIPSEEVVKHVSDAIHTFMDENSHSSLKKITFIIYYKDQETFKTFEKLKGTMNTGRTQYIF